MTAGNTDKNPGNPEQAKTSIQLAVSLDGKNSLYDAATTPTLRIEKGEGKETEWWIIGDAPRGQNHVPRLTVYRIAEGKLMAREASVIRQGTAYELTGTWRIFGEIATRNPLTISVEKITQQSAEVFMGLGQYSPLPINSVSAIYQVSGKPTTPNLLVPRITIKG